MKRRSNHAGNEQGGFALLIVFLFAAAVALMLYQQMPRVAFESEREKEQVLMDRGHQYVRAIQLYVIAYKKYPAKLEDLENTNNKRYLRHRYIDPFTGKDEWRLIHVNGAGQLTDSLVQKPPNPMGGSGASGTSGASGVFGGNGASGFGTFGSAFGSSGSSGPSGASGPPEVNAAVRQRPSDRTLVQPNGMGTPPANVDPNDPRYWPAITLTPSGASGAPGVPGQAGLPGQPPLPGQVPFPGQQPIPGQPPLPGQLYPGQQIPGQNPAGFPMGLPGQQMTGANPPGMPMTPMQNGNPAFPGQAGAAPNPVLGLIQQQLTNPPQPAANATSNMGSAGLAGVASTHTGPSIKVYKDHQKYQEWEFIFQLTNGQPGAPAQGNPLGPNQTAPGTGTSPTGSSPFGTSPFGTGSTPSSPMGSTPGPMTPNPQQQQQ